MIGFYKFSLELNLISNNHVLNGNEYVRSYAYNGFQFLVRVSSASGYEQRVIRRIPLDYNEMKFAKGGLPLLSSAGSDFYTVENATAPTIAAHSVTLGAFTSLPTNNSFTPGNTAIAADSEKIYGIDPHYTDYIIYLRQASGGTVNPLQINEPFCIFGNTTEDTNAVATSGTIAYDNSTSIVSDSGFGTVSAGTIEDKGLLYLEIPSKVAAHFRIMGFKCTGAALCTPAALTSTPATCGDDSFDAGEGCDLGFDDNQDGCDSQCQVTHGYECSNVLNSASVCAAVVCGNGKIEKFENCDDNSNFDGAGCARGCVGYAPGWVCYNDLSQEPDS